tara:strand:- start:3507 stop:3764 length:258 start_codon:yes stop_codon:yes gene_type:complete
LTLRLTYLTLAFAMTSCIDFTEEFNAIHNKEHIITCKHPLGHTISYSVSSVKNRFPYIMRGGLWKFKTKKGIQVISTYCHLEKKE